MIKKGGNATMSISADTLRGHTDTIILTQLIRGDNYGYEINKNIQQRTGGQYGFTVLSIAFRIPSISFLCESL